MADLLPDGHDEGDGCWCAPEVFQPCPECVRVMHYVPEKAAYPKRAGIMAAIFDGAEPGCWRCCGDGYVEPYDTDDAVLIVHRVFGGAES